MLDKMVASAGESGVDLKDYTVEELIQAQGEVATMLKQNLAALGAIQAEVYAGVGFTLQIVDEVLQRNGVVPSA